MARKQGGGRAVVQAEFWSLSAHSHLWSREEASNQAGAEGIVGDKVGRVGSRGGYPWLLMPVGTLLYQQWGSMGYFRACK